MKEAATAWTEPQVEEFVDEFVEIPVRKQVQVPLFTAVVQDTEGHVPQVGTLDMHIEVPVQMAVPMHKKAKEEKELADEIVEVPVSKNRATKKEDEAKVDEEVPQFEFDDELVEVSVQKQEEAAAEGADGAAEAPPEEAAAEEDVAEAPKYEALKNCCCGGTAAGSCSRGGCRRGSRHAADEIAQVRS